MYMERLIQPKLRKVRPSQLYSVAGELNAAASKVGLTNFSWPYNFWKLHFWNQDILGIKIVCNMFFSIEVQPFEACKESYSTQQVSIL